LQEACLRLGATSRSMAKTPKDPSAPIFASHAAQEVRPLDGLYSDWFLEYASYVILERAVPHINDGLKPVQRRIIHSLWEKDDGRYNKVANIVGHCMQYHPHGDASIGDAMVQLGQKELLIDTQGNWGNILTGDNAAASRYIEARLSKLAQDVVFSPKVTEWVASYDGRNKEPVTLPVQYPLLLSQGVEGIAVGLSCRILPHNFLELCDACIKVLKGEPFALVPDFPQGGTMDATDYDDGRRGGKVRIRAKIEQGDKKNLLRITSVPFGVTTGGLMESIAAANEKGKIKITRVEDITAEFVDVEVFLPAGADVDQTIQALYAFTDCEVSISPNAVVIKDRKPWFCSVSDIVRHNAEHTRDILQKELEIQLGELEEKWHFSSLEKIFIENRIYRKIEECETWDAVLAAIWKGLKPHLPLLKREVADDDVARLTEIKIKRISKFNSFEADEHIQGLEKQIKSVQKDLKQMTRVTIDHFERLKKDYGKGRERKTEIASFDRVSSRDVIIQNETLYLNAKDGFAGTGLKKEGEPQFKCSLLDDIIYFSRDGSVTVTKAAQKFFVGKNPFHVGIFAKEDPAVYSVMYRDGKDGPIMAKRFRVSGVVRDKAYTLHKGAPGSIIIYFARHENEAESDRQLLTLHLKEQLRLKNVAIQFPFNSLAIKGRDAQGNIVTKHPIEKIARKMVDTPPVKK
jgi:topoisomerase IV subunit A